MALSNDSKWTQIFNTSRLRNLSNEERIKLTNSIWKASKRLEHINLERKKKSLKVISMTEVARKERLPAVTTKKTCQSMTMSGKPCTFRAVSECGRFCKKHSL